VVVSCDELTPVYVLCRPTYTGVCDGNCVM
jgi:hypothetical protein